MKSSVQNQNTQGKEGYASDGPNPVFYEICSEKLLELGCLLFPANYSSNTLFSLVTDCLETLEGSWGNGSVGNVPVA